MDLRNLPRQRDQTTGEWSLSNQLLCVDLRDRRWREITMGNTNCVEERDGGQIIVTGMNCDTDKDTVLLSVFGGRTYKVSSFNRPSDYC